MNSARQRPTSTEPYGVRCPACRGSNSKVLETREGRGYIRRRHLCLTRTCLATAQKSGRRTVHGVRWTTYEFFSPRRGIISVPRDTRAIRSVLTLDL